MGPEMNDGRMVIKDDNQMFLRSILESAFVRQRIAVDNGPSRRGVDDAGVALLRLAVHQQARRVQYNRLDRHLPLQPEHFCQRRRDYAPERRRKNVPEARR